jgi:thiamine pyrophosphate-dependent acetolactate synthase large subunit-like protein
MALRDLAELRPCYIQSYRSKEGSTHHGKLATGAATLMASVQPAKAEQGAVDSAAPAPSGTEVLTTDRAGSDFMVDVLKTLNFEYILSSPSSDFRGLQESFINYGGNKNPEWITCLHEESSIAMAEGYFCIEGKPAIAMVGGSMGLQHAALPIFHAYADGAAVYVITGNVLDAEERRPGADWDHAVQDAPAIVRDFTKWDDTPVSLGHFAESAVRAYKISMTPPKMPVVLVADAGLAERPMDPGAKIRIPKYAATAPPQGDSGAVQDAARMLVAAEYPVIRVGKNVTRTANGMKLLVELAETLQAPVSGGNFPSRHPLSVRALGSPDVVLGLELEDFFGTVNSMRDQLYKTTSSRVRPGTKLISITATDLYLKSNYQVFQRFQEVDIAMGADAVATLPGLIEACKRLITPDRLKFFQDRGAKIAGVHQAEWQRTREEAAYSWDLSPISHARLAYELWDQIKNKDWSLVVGGDENEWSRRVWTFDKSYQYTGFNSDQVGCKAPAAVGAALANKKYGRLSINIQKDGDLMYANGVLWTAAHHRIPMLTIMHNNRAYHQEMMHLQRMSTRRNRDVTTAHIGTAIDAPNIDYAKLAQAMGWYAEGPITRKSARR